MYANRRKRLADKLQIGDAVILYSGGQIKKTLDETYIFSVNSNFYYLTGIDQEDSILLIIKTEKEVQETLFIKDVDPNMEKWFGRSIRPEAAKEISGIGNVISNSRVDATILWHVNSLRIRRAFFEFDIFSTSESPAQNRIKATEFSAKYPFVKIESAQGIFAEMRSIKDEEEISNIRTALAATKSGIERVMRDIKPGMAEYQMEACFLHEILFTHGCIEGFDTIMASGSNGPILHHVENKRKMEDGDLLLMDLGAEYNKYKSDVSRTIPVNGKFSPRQRAVYELVLKTNEKVCEHISPGIKFSELNELAKKTLAEGLVELGLIKDESEVGKYYYHGVSHHLGLDTHDIDLRIDTELKPGMVLTVEPGIYIEEENIGIRIEDDVLVTETGREILSKDIIKRVEDIEEFMKAGRC